MTDISRFQINTVVMHDVSASRNIIHLQYLLDGRPCSLKLSYDNIDFNDPIFHPSLHSLQTYLVTLAFIGFSDSGPLCLRHLTSLVSPVGYIRP